MPRTIGTPILDSDAATATFGIATLVTGAVTVSTTSVKAGSTILVTPMAGGTLDNLGVPLVQQADITPGNQFIIRSLDLGTGALSTVDNNKVSWMILESTNNP